MDLDLKCGKVVFYSTKIAELGYVTLGGLIASGRVGNFPDGVNTFAGVAVIGCAGLIELLYRDSKKQIDEESKKR